MTFSFFNFGVGGSLLEVFKKKKKGVNEIISYDFQPKLDVM